MNEMVPALQLNNERVGGDTGAPIVEPAEEGTQPPLLVEYWRTVDRWKWVIVAILITVSLLGLALTLLATPQFTATGRLQIDREEMRVTNVESLTPETVGRDNEFYETQYALLGARSLADRVARDLRLAADDEFLAAFAANSEDPEGRGQLVTANERAQRQERLVGALLANIDISSVRDSRLVDVSFTSPNPALSARIANAWMRAFAAQSVDRRFDSTADARRFLESRLQELRGRLEKSEREFVEYARANDIVALTTTTDEEGRTRAERTLVGDSLAALNAQLAQATADRIAAQSALGTSRNNQNSASYDATLVNLRQERAGLAAEHARLLVQFEPSYPAARQLQGQIDALDQSIAREERRVTQEIGDTYAAASREEAALRGRVEQLQGNLADQQSAGIRYNILQREVDTNRQLYDALLQRYKEIGVAGVGVSNISVVDQAEIPNSPSSPRLVINLLAALLIGIALSAAAVYVLEQSDEGIKEPSQVIARLGVPLLGSVPKIDEAPEEQISDPKSDYFEAFATIRKSLSFSTDHGLPRSFAISSTRPAEGKSTSSLALAVVISRMGRKVVLIEFPAAGLLTRRVSQEREHHRRSGGFFGHSGRGDERGDDRVRDEGAPVRRRASSHFK